MNYQEFLNYIKEHIVEVMEEQGIRLCPNHHKKKKIQYIVEIHKVFKNNGVVLDGLTIREAREHMSPNLYLNSYFEEYQMGKTILDIMQEIIFRYKELYRQDAFEVGDITDFSTIRDDIVVRLVHYDKNAEQLQNCPYIPYLDLAITFRYMVSRDACGLASSLISNTEFSRWNISVEELYEIALENTMQAFPYKINSLTEVMLELIKQSPEHKVSEQMVEEIEALAGTEESMRVYVLTNDVGINGATCILYHEVLREFALRQASDFYILPSSVHEVLLVIKDEKTDPAVLTEMVREANYSAVGLIDLLSDNIYSYEQETDRVQIVSL